jgi:peptidyl-prolyl cis-trans isomerase SurA
MFARLTSVPRSRPALSAGALLLLLALSDPALAQLRPVPLAPVVRLPAPPVPQAADFIVAVVNTDPITNNEVRARVARIEQQLAQQRQPAPPRDELAREVLEQLISERAQLDEARELGIRIEDSSVDQAEQNIARQNGVDVAELRRRVAADGVSPSVLRDDLRRQLTLIRLREREVDAQVRVSDAEIDQFLQEAAAQSSVGRLNLAQVLVAVPESASPSQVEALRARAQRVAERAKAGEDFTQLARQSSDAPDAALNGGAFGLREAERYPPLFLEAVQALPEGGVSEVVRSGAGFHILKVLQRERQAALGVTQQRARHILLRPGPQFPEAAARQRLQDFQRRVVSGQADFAALAREHSQDASAASGGDLGWASPGSFVPEFEEVLQTLAPGQVAPPFVSRFGVHLVQLLERRQVTLSPREQRDFARNVVRERKAAEAYDRWAQNVRGRAFVQLREPPQ